MFEVRTTVGDAHLVDHLIQKFRRENKKVRISTNPHAFCHLRMAYERAKRILSSAVQTTIEVESLYDSIYFCTSLSPVENFLRDSKIDKASVHETDGFTRIPGIVKFVSDSFSDMKPINTAIVTLPGRLGTCPSLTSPLSLCNEAAGSVITALIKCNTTVPTKKSEYNEDQSSILIQDNHIFGKSKLSDIPSMPRVEPAEWHAATVLSTQNGLYIFQGISMTINLYMS
ncbi:70 kDa heat shock protein [Phellopilus nigrolimitatus]|nr:70 kDa heat shock protein [Phellopilus nigrolimitatus]